MNSEPIYVASLNDAGLRCARFSERLSPIVDEYLKQESLSGGSGETAGDLKTHLAALKTLGVVLQQLEGKVVTREEISLGDTIKFCDVLGDLSDFLGEFQNGALAAEDVRVRLAHAFPEWSPDSDANKIVSVFRDTVAKLMDAMPGLSGKTADLPKLLAYPEFRADIAAMMMAAFATRNDSGVQGPVGRKLRAEEFAQLKSLIDGKSFRFKPENVEQITLSDPSGLRFTISCSGTPRILLLAGIFTSEKRIELSLADCHIRLKNIRGDEMTPTLSSAGSFQIEGLIPKQKYTIKMG